MCDREQGAKPKFTKHVIFGLVAELTKAEFDALRNGWNGSEVLKTNPFFREIEQQRIERERGAR